MTRKSKDFWPRLQQAMREKGYKDTQGAVATLLKIAQPSVSKWTKGGKPTMKHAVALAEKLEVSVEWLLTERGPKRPLSATETALVELFQQLKSEMDRGEVFGLLRALLRRGPRDPDRPYPFT